MIEVTRFGEALLGNMHERIGRVDDNLVTTVEHRRRYRVNPNVSVRYVKPVTLQDDMGLLGKFEIIEKARAVCYSRGC